MVVLYVDYVNRSRRAALLWSAQLGLFHANAAASPILADVVASEAFAAIAQSCARTLRADSMRILAREYLVVPLIGANGVASVVLGLEDAALAELPAILHELHEHSRHFSQIVHLLPQIVLTARPNGMFDYASRRWSEVTGASIDQFDVRGSLLSALEPADAQGFLDLWKSGVANGKAFAFEVRLHTREGLRWHQVHAAPSIQNGRVRKWIVTFEDIQQAVEERTALADARNRLHVLAEVGQLLSDTTLDVTHSLERTLELAASVLAGKWFVSFRSHGRTMPVYYPSDAKVLVRSLPSMAAECKGRLVSVQRWSDDAPRPVLYASLDAGDQAENFLIAAGVPGSTLLAEDREFFRELAARLGAFLRSALAYDRERTLAHALQKAMLPTALPQVPGLLFDVAYRTAENAALVGGDWYDAFDLPSGRIACTIGDVAGHGLDAAVAMGHIREIVRIHAMQGASPGEVLENVNRAVVAGSLGITTAFVGFIDPLTFSFSYASAGHVEPRVVDQHGVVSKLNGGDLMLGATNDTRYHTFDGSIPAESALVLYTDGLVEFNHDPGLGETRLDEVLAAWGRHGFADSASHIADRTLNGSPARDDIAILILRFARIARIAATIGSVPKNVHRARMAVGRVLESAPLTSEQRDLFVVAISEALNNAVEHGSTSENDIVRFAVDCTQSGVRASVHSAGKWRFNEPSIERGRGLPLMRAIADEVGVDVDEAGTTVHLFMRGAGAASAIFA